MIDFIVIIVIINYISESIFALNSFFLTNPTKTSFTSPFLRKTNIGIFRTPNCTAMSLFSSVSHFPITTLPLYSSANSSTIGVNALQGPHHYAQKSITTSWSLFMIESKFSELIANAMMIILS